VVPHAKVATVAEKMNRQEMKHAIMAVLLAMEISWVFVFHATQDVIPLDAPHQLHASTDALMVLTMLVLNQIMIVSLVMALALLQVAMDLNLRTVLVVTQLGRD
jgi:hypothetical protein